MLPLIDAIFMLLMLPLMLMLITLIDLFLDIFEYFYATPRAITSISTPPSLLLFLYFLIWLLYFHDALLRCRFTLYFATAAMPPAMPPLIS